PADRARAAGPDRPAAAHPQHPWHRLLAVLGHRGGAGAGHDGAPCRDPRPWLAASRHRPRRRIVGRAGPWPGPSLPRILEPGMSQITILGAGVMGLCIATELAARGVLPRIIDPAGKPGSQACSWRAGGMLAP